MSSPWSCLKLNYVPMTMGVICSLGLITCYIVAVLRNDVSPYVPFISETGGKFPEAGLFSIFLYLTSTIALSTMFVRYMIVAELNKGIDRMTDVLNRASIVIGFIALMGMVVVAAYPMTSIGTVHGIGANVLFLGGVIYAILQTFLTYKMSPTYNGLTICHIRLIVTCIAAISLIANMSPLRFYGLLKSLHGSEKKLKYTCQMTSVVQAHNVGANTLFIGVNIYAVLQTWISFKMSPYYNGKQICYIRLVITILGVLSLIALLVIGPLAFDDWTSVYHDHWTGSKVPNDKGFGLMLGSAIAEWAMALSFLAYYFTFIREFGKVFMHLRVQLLVTHFDEEPQDINTANERTPMVM